jgi:hypothetical protein
MILGHEFLADVPAGQWTLIHQANSRCSHTQECHTMSDQFPQDLLSATQWSRIVAACWLDDSLRSQFDADPDSTVINFANTNFRINLGSGYSVPADKRTIPPRPTSLTDEQIRDIEESGNELYGKCC